MRILVLLIVLTLGVVVHAAPAPAEEHYQKACQLRDSGDLAGAIECVAKGIALNPTDKALFAKCELLSAQLYVAMEMLDAADVTARQIQVLYRGTSTAEQATALRAEITRLKAAQAAETETDGETL